MCKTELWPFLTILGTRMRANNDLTGDEQIADCIPVELMHRIVYLIAKRNEHQ